MQFPSLFNVSRCFAFLYQCQSTLDRSYPVQNQSNPIRNLSLTVFSRSSLGVADLILLDELSSRFHAVATLCVTTLFLFATNLIDAESWNLPCQVLPCRNCTARRNAIPPQLEL